jgi:hypothetical protein
MDIWIGVADMGSGQQKPVTLDFSRNWTLKRWILY